jgi:hypothetical protein
MKPKSLSQRVLDALDRDRHGLLRTKFLATMRAQLSATLEFDEDEDGSLTRAEYIEEFLPIAYLPDGYWIDAANKEVTWVEVDDTNPTTDEKIQAIAWLNDALHDAEWGLNLTIIRIAPVPTRYDWTFDDIYPNVWRDIDRVQVRAFDGLFKEEVQASVRARAASLFNKEPIWLSPSRP